MNQDVLRGYFCHQCGCRPVEGVKELLDGDFECLHCGTSGFVEPAADETFLQSDSSEAPRSTLEFRRASAPSEFETSNYPTRSSPLQLITLPPLHIPSSSSFSSGFQICLSNVSQTRVVPGVLPPVSQTAQPPFQNIAAPEFMNAFFEDLSRRIFDSAGVDRIFQFEFETETSNLYGSPPASAAIVASLPEETLTAETAVGDCAICQEDFKLDDKVKRFPCLNHCFHSCCINPWLLEHNSCPVCRYELPTDDPNYEHRRLARQSNAQPTQ